ncbi:MAG: CAP domain-containing protein [Bacteroidales bacterium]|nr:CAP domain-containing protein [Bacteroidales bacterium]
MNDLRYLRVHSFFFHLQNHPMTIIHFLLPVFLLFVPGCATQKLQAVDRMQLPKEICLNPYEMELYQALNTYREKHNLPAITLSKSLTLVAQVHCRDLAINQPDKDRNCNMHSWSRKGPWTSCCYTPDHKRSSCMWDKPKELTSYTGEGYEIAFFSTVSYSNATAFAEDAMFNWMKSKGHNDVMLNLSIWKSIQWKAVGIGYFEGYTTIWFGAYDDPDTAIVGACN